MSAIWIIAKRELNSFFDSLVAYIMLIAFLGFSGFFTWLFGSDIFLVKEASLQVFFGVAFWTLVFLHTGHYHASIGRGEKDRYH